MRTKIFVTSLSIVIGSGSIGCKSASKLAWWQTADNAKADSTALAHTAPDLPSEIAKQAEGLTTKPSIEIAGGQAAPFVPNTAATKSAADVAAMAATSGAYPNTGATGYNTGATGFPVTSETQATTTPTSVASHTDSVMPYNPDAVPPAANLVAAATTAAPSVEDRYGFSSTTSSASVTPVAEAGRYQSTTVPSQSGSTLGTTASTAVSSTVPDTAIAFTDPTIASPAETTSVAIGNVGTDRYSRVSVAEQTSVSNVPTADYSASVTPELPPTDALQSPITPTTTKVASSPYRPGGTSTYPSMVAVQPAVEVASLPSPRSESTEQQVPHVATPGESTEQIAPPPLVPRYR